VSIVWQSRHPVDRYAALGREVDPPRPRCPACGGPTQRWSGYARHVRDDRDHLIWVPRVRCARCGVTQALLPSFVLPGRWDAVAHVGRAAELAAEGLGHRPIAALLLRPESTVRAWLRRLRSTVAPLTTLLLARAVAMGWSGFDLPVAPLPRLVAAVRALAGRWPGDMPAGPWAIASLVTGGGWLATNTDTPLAPRRRSGHMASTRIEEVSDGP
jgi:hypothetical protein